MPTDEHYGKIADFAFAEAPPIFTKHNVLSKNNIFLTNRLIDESKKVRSQELGVRSQEFQCEPNAETNLFGYAEAMPEIMSEANNQEFFEQ